MAKIVNYEDSLRTPHTTTDIKWIVRIRPPIKYKYWLPKRN